eukprot:TRINITY_DN504_c2_g2_i2.p1 TRINITY_DN504_c2_g2~~TRINITY_DN504_c2_g2_i2.p1  ORF type:complete len:102 (+),score=4.46 TRINITY_DN504_c2_g2_i2:64-369(+)
MFFRPFFGHFLPFLQPIRFSAVLIAADPAEKFSRPMVAFLGIPVLGILEGGNGIVWFFSHFLARCESLSKYNCFLSCTKTPPGMDIAGDPFPFLPEEMACR